MSGRSPDSASPLWLLPNLLSLDAPLVALVWQDFLSRATQTPLLLPARVVLGLTVWAIYLADRILDVRKPVEAPESERHRFYRRHRRLAVWAAAAILVTDAAVTLLALRPVILHNGILALGAVSAYLLVVHRGHRKWVPKEAAVAVLFSVGTFLVAWSWSPNPRELAAPAVVFAMLCFANLTAIESWEWRGLRGAKTPRPHPFILWLEPRLTWSLLGLAGACLVASVRYPILQPAALCAVLMLLLWKMGGRLGLNARRALVDLVLFTPLVFLR